MIKCIIRWDLCRITGLALVGCIGMSVTAESLTEPPQSFKLAANCIAKGEQYLAARQKDNGSWLDHPAITALAVLALIQNDREPHGKFDKSISDGLNYVLQFVKDDGSIWSRKSHEYPNYTTSIALLALVTVNRPEDIAVIKAARKYLIQSQFSNQNSDDYGGIGYGKTGRADLSNLNWAAEALHHSDYLDREPLAEDSESGRSVDQLWKRVQIFLTNCQNLPGINNQHWVSSQPGDFGGFVYRPNESKAGQITDASGRVSLLSCGSMTYAGLKSMIYAKLDKNDKRVIAALDYARKHYIFTENPGMGSQAHYYYLHLMAKALDAHGENTLVDAQGVRHNWRDDLLSEICRLQKVNGSWANVNGRFMESVPELATTYCVIAMKVALGTPN